MKQAAGVRSSLSPKLVFAASVFCVLCCMLYLSVVLYVLGVCIPLVGVCALVAEREGCRRKEFAFSLGMAGMLKNLL